MSKERKNVMADKVFINVKFATIVYDNKKDKKLHFHDMIDDGWSIDEDDGLTVHFKKAKNHKVK